MIKLGYVSRSLPKDNKNHVILGTQAVKPKDIAMQVHSAAGTAGAVGGRRGHGTLAAAGCG